MPGTVPTSTGFALSRWLRWCVSTRESPASRFGPPTATRVDVLVWGDSHAGALMPAFKALGEELGVAGILAIPGGCPPIFGMQRADRGLECLRFNNSVATLIQARAIHTVVLAAFWSRYTDLVDNASFGQILFRDSTNHVLSAEKRRVV